MILAPWPDWVRPQLGRSALHESASWSCPAVLWPETGSRRQSLIMQSLWVNPLTSLTPYRAGCEHKGGISTNSSCLPSQCSCSGIWICTGLSLKAKKKKKERSVIKTHLLELLLVCPDILLGQVQLVLAIWQLQLQLSIEGTNRRYETDGIDLGSASSLIPK